MANVNYQYEPLPVPSGWGREERAFAQRLTDVLDDIYLKWGRISEKELSGALRKTIRGKADVSALENYSTVEQTAEMVRSQVGTMTFGGRNLLRGTDKPIECGEDGVIGRYERMNQTGLAGKHTQLHFDLEAAPGSVIRMAAGQETIAVHTALGGGEQVRIAHTFASDAWTEMEFYVSNSSGTTKISRVQLERGDAVTDWGQADGELIAGSNVEITKDHVWIRTPVFSVGCGGDEYMALDSEGGYFPRLRSPQAAARYDGPEILRVGSGEADGVHVFASLTDALDAVNGRWLDADVVIEVQNQSEHSAAEIQGLCGRGSLTIQGGDMVVYGGVTVERCAVPITIQSLKVYHTDSPLVIRACAWVLVEGCVMETGGNVPVVYVSEGSTVRLTETEMASGNFALRAWYGSRVTVYNCSGNRNLCSHGAFVLGSGTLPSASGSTVTTTAYQSGYISVSGTPSQGKGAGAVGSGSISLDAQTVYVRETGYYQTVWNAGGYLYQGYSEPYGAMTGCMWFDVSALAGKKAGGAKLRLTRVAGYGGSGAAAVRLVGLGQNCTGVGSSFSRKKEYGVIGYISPGATKHFTIPSAAAQDLIDGTIGGFGLYTQETSAQPGLGYSVGYARFYGTAGDDNTRPRLTIQQ